jgi:proline iminopeptidase
MYERLKYTAVCLVAMFLAPGLLISQAPAQSMYRPGMVRAGNTLRAPLQPPEQPAGEKCWVVEPDIKLHHFSEGKGKKYILIVHGGPGYPSPEVWPGLKPLTEGFTVHYYHQRGCGKSTRPIEKFESSNYFANMMSLDKTLGLGAQIADIERIRRILGSEKLVLVGHSFGAVIACLYAAEFPEHLEALVLVAPAGAIKMPMEEGNSFEEIAKRLPEEKKKAFAAYQKEYFDFGNIFSKTEKDLAKLNGRFAEFYTAAMGEKTVTTATTPDPENIGGWIAFAIYFSMGRRYDYRDPLKKVGIPVLVIHGEEDLQPEKVSRMYVDCFPDARLEVIKASSHFPYKEKPDDFGRIVRNFLCTGEKSLKDPGGWESPLRP